MKEQINTPTLIPTLTPTQTNSAVCELEQIKELAKTMCRNGMKDGDCAIDDSPCDLECVYGSCAELLYNAGYRKQSEPFSCGHEKGGEWVKLPCKVGDILYVISQMKDKRILPFINEYEVTSLSIRKKSIIVYHEMDGYIKKFKQADFEKTIFLTREEAEKALAERKGSE